MNHVLAHIVSDTEVLEDFADAPEVVIAFRLANARVLHDAGVPATHYTCLNMN